MDMYGIMKARRSCRRFDGRPVTRRQLADLMELARLAPSAANRQPMRYCAVSDPAILSRIHPHVHWAGYTQPLGGPEPGEEPAAYIALIADTAVKADCAQDEGIAGAAITYGAESMGLASCWLGAIDRPEISDLLRLPDGWKLMSMIALGYPRQQRVLETGDDARYWLEDGVLHVPKKSADKVEFFDAI